MTSHPISKDYRLKQTIIDENNLSCFLKNNSLLYEFANEILYKLIKLAKKAKFTKTEIIDILKVIRFNPIIGKTKKQKYNRIPQPKFTLKTNPITKNGYNCNLNICNKLLNIDTLKQFIAFNKYNKITLLQITSAFYKFQISNKLITYCISKNSKLKLHILNKFKKYFHTEDNITYNDIEKLINKSEGHWFRPWFYFFVDSNIPNLFHRNLNEDKDYIRQWKMHLDNASDVLTRELKGNECLEEQYNVNDNVNHNDNNNINSVVTGNTYMKPTYNGIWWNIMKQYNKQILAGPSISSVLCYELLFNISKIVDKTFENKVKLLCLIIADYYPIHHSISEILQLYTEDAKFPKYNLSLNDCNYLKTLINMANLQDLMF
jgi:hypothetical protein